MEKIHSKYDNYFIVGGRGCAEIFCLTKSKLGIASFSKIFVSNIQVNSKVLRILSLTPFSGRNDTYLLAFGMEGRGLRIGRVIEKEGVMQIKMEQDGKFMQSIPSVNGEAKNR